jgi:hypothetical protein
MDYRYYYYYVAQEGEIFSTMYSPSSDILGRGNEPRAKVRSKWFTFKNSWRDKVEGRHELKLLK